MKKSLVFRGLSHYDLRIICDIVNPVRVEFEKDEILVEQEVVWKYFGVVENGYLKDMRYVGNTKPQLLRSHWPTSVINLEGAASDFGTSPTEIKATSDGSLVWFPYKEIAQNSKIRASVREAFLSNVACFVIDDSIRFMNKLFVMSWRQTQDRIMNFFRILKRKSKDDYIDLGMTQAEFAQYLCVDVTTLTDTLNRMKREGLIDYKRQKKDGIYRVMF
jgi:CRP-like cAMP-binding protein